MKRQDIKVEVVLKPSRERSPAWDSFWSRLLASVLSEMKQESTASAGQGKGQAPSPDQPDSASTSPGTEDDNGERSA